MATTYTPLLELPKHATTDPFDITKINDGFDLIDAGMAKAYRGKAVHNLLDNSDFRAAHFIAQAGPNGMHGITKYVGDRWISRNADATFADGYITPGSPIDQRFDPAAIDMAATYTAAICLADGTIKVASGNFTSGFGSLNLGIYCPAATTQPYVRLQTGLNIRWAALYEGAYTAETLPAYVYKGYAAELAECQRYCIVTRCFGAGYATSDTAGNLIVPIPTTMRATPSISSGLTFSAHINGNYRQNTIRTYSVRDMDTNMVRIALTGPAGTFVAHQPFIGYCNAAAVLSADL